MKNTRIVLGAVLLMMMLAGCTEKKEYNIKNEDIEKEYDTNEDSLTNSIGGDNSYQFSIETDSQADLGEYNNRVFTENGYYIFRYTTGDYSVRRLFYYDYQSKQEVLVCNKGNCLHDNEGCNAYFDSDKYPIQNIWYYKGSLYLPAQEDEYLYVEKISLDGTTREKKCSIARVTEKTEESGEQTVTSTYYPQMMMHKGCVYYSTSYPGCKKAELYKLDIEGKAEAELIAEIEGESVQLYRMKGYQDDIYYQLAEFENDGTLAKGGLYKYTSSSGENSCLIEDAVSYYCLKENGDIFIHNYHDNQIVKVSGDGKQDAFYDLGDAECNGFMWDTNRFLIYTMGDEYEKQYVLDEDGSVINECIDYNQFILPYQPEK